MQNFQENARIKRSLSEFISFKPAELCVNSQWLVIFYVKNPATQKMERFRLSVPFQKSNEQRLAHGQKIVNDVNFKLSSGWSPFLINTLPHEKTFDYCKNLYLDQIKKEVENNTKRIDTHRSYVSYLNMIDKFCGFKKIKLNSIKDFDKIFVVNYLDWIYFERENSPRTFNNHLLFISTFINYCINHGFLKDNFASSISKKRENSKIRQTLTPIEKSKLKQYGESNFNFFAMCMLTYYCFVRRTELTKLKVSDVKLFQNYISISEDISKNRKNECVTIPNEYAPILAKHLQNAASDHYLFGKNDFRSGSKQMNPKKASDEWERFRKLYAVDAKYQFYSLKDTGITDLLGLGIAAIKVRDQARHYDLKITESYTPRNQSCDEVVKNSNISF